MSENIALFKGRPLHTLIQRRFVKKNKRPNYFRFTALEDGCTIALNKVGTPYDCSIEYSYNRLPFEPYVFGTVIPFDEGDTVEWRRTPGMETPNFTKDTNNCYSFAVTGQVVEGGYVTTLFKNDGMPTSIGSNPIQSLLPSNLAAAPLELDPAWPWMSFNRGGFSGPLVIPEGITFSHIFSYNRFTEVTIPVSMTSMDRYYWDGNPLTAIYYNGTIAQWLGITFGWADNPLAIAHNLYIGGRLVTECVVPEGTTEIKKGVMNGAWCLSEPLVLPASVEKIGECAFQICKNIPSVTFPEGLKTIGVAAFRGCTGLTQVSLPEGLTEIKGHVFWDCTGLTQVTLGGNGAMTFMEDYSFYNCHNLHTVYFRGTLEDWMNCSFYREFSNPCFAGADLYCDGVLVEHLEIEKRTSINFQFQSVRSLKSITFKDNVLTNISNAFKNCTGLTQVTLPEGLTDITNAFSGCTGLTQVTIPGSVTNMSGAFNSCTGLTQVTLSEGVTDLGYAFQSCHGLKQITIPSTVTDVGSAFIYITDLTLTLLPTTPPIVGSQFNFRGSITKIYVPYSTDHSVLEAYKTASGWSGYSSITFELNSDGSIPT